MPMTEHSILGLGPHGFHRLVYFEWAIRHRSACWSACTA